MSLPDDEDEVFRQIVAGLSEESSDPVPRWPVSEDTDAAHPAAPPSPPGDAALPAWLEPEPLEDDGHFVPPEPPRLPHVRLRVVAAALLVLGGLAALFTPYRVGLDESGGSVLIGMVLAASGAVLLVQSLREGPGQDDGPDDGAVV